MKTTITGGAILIVAGIAYTMWPAATHNAPTGSSSTLSGGIMADVTLPESLSQNAEFGKRGFEAKCAACHGMNAAGQDSVAPPLVHVIYEPGHHADESFQRAAALGVQAHHWGFGNMPAIEGVTRGDVSMIVTYIRELQQANGIK